MNYKVAMSHHQQSIVIDKPFLRSFVKLFNLYWFSAQKWLSVSLGLISIALTIIAIRGSVLLNNGNKAFFDALQQFDMSGVLASFIPMGVGIFVYIGSEAIAYFCKERLCAKWRLWLTNHYLSQWFTNHKHYHLQLEGSVDNPDQRISEDLDAFPTLTLGLFFLLIQALLIIGSYGYILWGTANTLVIPIAGKSISIYGYLFWTASLYGLINILVTQKIGKQLSALDFSKEQFSANFRFSLIRAREASEQIALLKHEASETTRLTGIYDFIFVNYLKIIALKTRLNFCLGFFSGSGSLVGGIAALPLFFSKQLQIGGLMQVASAFGMIFSAFSMLAQSFDVFAQWKSVVFRLTQFKTELDRVKPDLYSPEIVTEESTHIQITNLSIYLPDGLRIIDSLTLSFKLGSSYLIQGSSGRGKSVFLRTLAGIWPFAEGKIIMPANQSIFFLPQKPYLPIGSLKELLLSGNTDATLNDEALILILEQSRLDKYLGSLNEVNNWQQILSLGEQQLLFLAQIFIKKPDIIVLDESTSALDEQAEVYFYKSIKRILPHATLISVGHRATLRHLHEHAITLSDEADELLAVAEIDMV